MIPKPEKTYDESNYRVYITSEADAYIDHLENRIKELEAKLHRMANELVYCQDFMPDEPGGDVDRIDALIDDYRKEYGE